MIRRNKSLIIGCAIVALLYICYSAGDKVAPTSQAEKNSQPKYVK